MMSNQAQTGIESSFPTTRNDLRWHREIPRNSGVLTCSGLQGWYAEPGTFSSTIPTSHPAVGGRNSSRGFHLPTPRTRRISHRRSRPWSWQPPSGRRTCIAHESLAECVHETERSGPRPPLSLFSYGSIYRRGPVGVREISSTISPTAFSLAPIATSACARTPTSRLSSSTTGRRRT